MVLIAGYWLAIFAAFAFALEAPSATIGWHRQVVFYLGVVLLVLGVLLRQYAIATLGRLHTLDVSTGSAQPVIQTDPYRWVRHPSYAGAMQTAGGFLLSSTNWLSLACYVVVVGANTYRIWVEEDALTKDLGEAYRAYMRRTKRLIPHLT